MQQLEALIDGKLTKHAALCCWGKDLQINYISHTSQSGREEK